MRKSGVYFALGDSITDDGSEIGDEVTSIKISWKNLSYSIKTPILHNESGYVESGEAMFILGASGAGKTTLLNALWDRLPKNRKWKLSGEVLVNDTSLMSQKHFGQYGAYVMQDDILFQTFTWEECLMFAAKLRLNLPKDQLKKRVDDIIHQLGLQSCRNTYVGNPILRGMSGGEKKRTAIAVELVTNPSVIFLDEPTSGLDSFNAEKIIKLLIGQARMGKTIISTIHQPNSECFASFDKILLLMEGHTIFQGPARESVDYFKKIGFWCPEYSNPADYFLKEFSYSKLQSLHYEEKVIKLSSSYIDCIAPIVENENSSSSQIIVKRTGSRSDSLVSFDKSEFGRSLAESGFRKISWSIEFWVLMKRTFIDIYRNPMYMAARIGQTIMSGLLALALFWNLGYDLKGIENKIRFIYFVAIDQTMMTMFPVLMVFLNERDVFIREYANHTYGCLSYYLAKTFVELPFLAFMSAMYATIVYFGVGLQATLENFLWFQLVLLAIVFWAGSFGFIIGTAITSPDVAIRIAPFVISPLILLSGVMSNLDNVSVTIRWMQYISPIRYGWEALLRNEFDDNPKYQFNPISGLQYNVGSSKCIVYIMVIAIVLRFVAFGAIKMRISKAQ
jgi:ATP-binding cassette, subfamily G (WHITE), eye pigment precursor transporter